MRLLDRIKKFIRGNLPEKYSKIDASILKFDKDIANVISMCLDFKGELKELRAEMNEVGNSYSAKLLSNEKIDIFVKRYSEIVISYDLACKEFAKTDSDLEKIMFSEGDVIELARDVEALIAEVKSQQSFGSNFEGAVSYIFETLAPTVDRIIEVGQAIQEKVRETPPK